MTCLLLVFAVVQKQRQKKIKHKEEMALRGIGLAIGDRLYSACPDTKWKWVCRPTGFALNGGIARIEVVYPTGTKQFMDVCLSTSGYMALHTLNVSELTASAVGSTANMESLADAEKAPVPTAPQTGTKPFDEESVAKWYNIVLKDALETLVGDIHAKDEYCLYIGSDGKAYVEDNNEISVIYEFGEMPDVTLWEHITEKLGAGGLTAEVQEGNCIFISWA